MSEHVIDATKKTVGRVASEAARLLIGKHLPSFRNNQTAVVKVIVKNLPNSNFTGKKMDQKLYYRHSGYLGNLKEIKLKTLWGKNPKEVFRQMVSGMLPKNKLRSVRIKNLIIE